MTSHNIPVPILPECFWINLLNSSLAQTVGTHRDTYRLRRHTETHQSSTGIYGTPVTFSDRIASRWCFQIKPRWSTRTRANYFVTELLQVEDNKSLLKYV